jgi:hypothetical protein
MRLTCWTSSRHTAQTAKCQKSLRCSFIAMMVLHLIRPLGLPGLRQRRDVWKIAVGALVAIGATVLIGHG